MAEDIKKVVKVETAGSEVTIKSLRKEMSDLRDTILNLDKGSKEYSAAVEKLQSNQSRLNEVMKLSKSTAEQEENALKKLQKEIKQYRADVLAAEEGTEEWKIAMQNLADAQFQLRDMNETARYSVNDLGEQLANCGKIMTGVMAGFSAAQGVVALFGKENENLQKVMVKLQAGMAIVQGLEGLEGLSKHFNGLITVVKNATKTLGTAGWLAVITLVATAITALIGHFKNLSNQQNFYTKIVEDSTRAVKEFNYALAEEERQLSRNERIMKALGDSEEDILKKRLKTLTLLKENAWWEFSDASSQLALLEQGTEAYETQKQLVDELEQTYLSLGDRVIDTKNELAALAIEAQRAAKETAAATATILANPPESNLTGDEIKIDDSVPIIKDEKIETKSNGAADKASYAIYAKELTLRMELAKTILMNEEERYAKEYELIQNFNEQKLALLDEAIRKETDPEKIGALMQEKANLEIEIEENKNNRLAELREKDAENEKRREMQRKMAIQMSVNSVSGLLGTLADLYENGSKDSEKNAKKAKQLKIAQATIDTLYGSVTAYMGTMKAFEGMPWAIPIAILNAGTVLASGMATISKIKSSDPINGSGGGASVEPAQTFATAMPMTAENQATNLTNMENINGSQKVYILESDIQSSNKRVEIRESESTF